MSREGFSPGASLRGAPQAAGARANPLLERPVVSLHALSDTVAGAE